MTTQDKINEIMRLLDRAQQLLDEAYADHPEEPLDMVDSDNPHIGSDASEFFELLKESLEEAVEIEREEREWLDAPCVGLEYGSDDYNDDGEKKDV